MTSLLLEFFSEEIPARMQAGAARSLEQAFADQMAQTGLVCQRLKTYVTPRRLALVAYDIPLLQPDVTQEKKGPKTTAPQSALDGFLRATGLPLSKLEKRMVGKDETWFAAIHQKGQPTADVLKHSIEKILEGFTWPKSMRWGSGNSRWVRPLHSILCLFDGKIVPVEFGGITAGNVTYGHRFLAPEAITLHHADEYLTALKKAYVLADYDERKAEILKQADALAAKHGLLLKRDDGLLAEVTGLVEWPTLLMGSIDARFMDLPWEVLVSEMRAHQKYFALTAQDGTFCDKFLITSNMVTSDAGESVIAGNERVLRARLSDGRFFWDQDRKKSLSEWAKGLEGVTFHAKIGTIAQKVEHIKLLAIKLSHSFDRIDKNLVERAASLCKADLVTGMVGEFPELQGVMGRYYALAQKEDAQVADAIRDHYLPLGPDSPVPAKPVSVCLALADKLDTLVSMFAAGEKPTGSKDPFALRRQALGIIRIILENNLRLPLKTYFNDELLAFFSDRLKVRLKEQGIRHDLIAAVMETGDDDLVRVVDKTKALQEFLATEDGKNLLAAYRRAGNIVGIEEKKDKQNYKGDVKPELLQQPEEKSLYERMEESRLLIQQAIQEEKFDWAMKSLAAMRERIDAFFEKVLVNADDKALRTNRLSLLARFRGTLEAIADFALIEG